jgi:hypothetical protein
MSDTEKCYKNRLIASRLLRGRDCGDFIRYLYLFILCFCLFPLLLLSPLLFCYLLINYVYFRAQISKFHDYSFFILIIFFGHGNKIEYKENKIKKINNTSDFPVHANNAGASGCRWIH